MMIALPVSVSLSLVTISISMYFTDGVTTQNRANFYHSVSNRSRLQLENCDIYKVSLVRIRREMDCSSKCNEMPCCLNYEYYDDGELCLLCFSCNRSYNNLARYSEVTPSGGKLYEKVMKTSWTNCANIWKENIQISGVYTIIVSGHAVNVYCDMATSGGGWTVFQRRQNGRVSFTRNWTEYEHGFGDFKDEFWLGNSILSSMTSTPDSYRLRIDIEAFSTETRYAEYENFSVGNKTTKYSLAVGNYSGTAGDGGRGLSYVNGMTFTTVDSDGDNTCAKNLGGGFWYQEGFSIMGCSYVTPNGKYKHSMVNAVDGIVWYPWKHYNTHKATEMKFRPMNFP